MPLRLDHAPGVDQATLDRAERRRGVDAPVSGEPGARRLQDRDRVDDVLEHLETCDHVERAVLHDRRILDAAYERDDTPGTGALDAVGVEVDADAELQTHEPVV